MVKLKDTQKKFFKILLPLSTLLLIILFFIGSFSGLILNSDFYSTLYEKSGAYDRIGVDVADKKTDELFLFFKEKNILDTDFFTSNELSHMDDVRSLIKNVFIVYYFAMFLLLASMILIYRFSKDHFALFLKKLLFYSGISTIAIVVLFLLFNFSFSFDIFHKMFFSGNYTFPASSNLIRLFNQEFFFLFSKKIFSLSFVKGLISASAGGFLLFKKQVI